MTARIAVVVAVSAASVAAAGQSAAPLPDSTLPIRLVGVALDRTRPGNSLSFIHCRSNGAEEGAAEAFRTGEIACNVAEIREIRERAAVIMNLTTDRLELLPLGGEATSAVAQPPAADPTPAPAVVTPSKGLVTVDLRKDLVDHYLANMDEVLSSALATPYRGSTGAVGTIEGFELGQIKTGGAAERLGFQNGDVIVEVNGVKLDSLDAVLRLMSQGPRAKQVQMSVLRNGQPLTFVFNTK